MAVTKIHGIKTTVNKAIEYICNSEKTDEQIYISSFACSPETAALDFKYTLDHTAASASVPKQDKENKAFHLIQAFLPGEISYDEAHKIGKKLADQLLQGKYSYVLTTHIDKGHIHNHLIFCAADNIDYNHYHDCKETYWNIRKLSDRLCKEHGLSVIDPNGKRGLKYNEWYAVKTDSSWKSQIRKDISQSIKDAATYEEFLAFMKAKGYEMKGTSLAGSDGKYISFRPLGKDRFVRGSIKSLGKNYTRMEIAKRIETKQRRDTHSSQTRKIIDITADPKFSENIGLKKWASRENLKIAAETYSQMISRNIHSFSELEHQLNILQKQKADTNNGIISLERQLRDMAEIIKYATQYKENKSFNDRYEKAKDPDRFLRRYESSLILYSGAERMLRRKGFDPASLNLNKLKKHYQELSSRKNELEEHHYNIQKQCQELSLIHKNLTLYLDRKSLEQDLPSIPFLRDI